jgi:tetratricopeptide (TPR) repeat protein
MIDELILAYPSRSFFWQTKALVYYRLGKYQASLDAITKSVDIVGASDWYDRYLLAMTNYQLGNRKKAHEWLNELKEIKTESIDTILRPKFVRMRSEAVQILVLQ